MQPVNNWFSFVVGGGGGGVSGWWVCCRFGGGGNVLSGACLLVDGISESAGFDNVALHLFLLSKLGFQ